MWGNIFHYFCRNLKRMKKEIWVEHPCEKVGTSFTKFEISNFGRLKIYNHLSPEGRITEGTLINGVPTYIYKIYRPVPERDQKQFDEAVAQYQEARKMVTKFRYQPVKLAYYKKERDKFKEKKKKLNQKLTKKREKSVILLLHRLVAQHFLEKPTDKDKIFVIHKDFDKKNNHVDNLAWASQDEITARHPQQPKLVLHKFKRQLYNIRQSPRHMKLSENDVLYIKKRLKKDDNPEKLAQRFGVGTATIKRIKDGKSWSHVKLVEELLDEKKK